MGVVHTIEEQSEVLARAFFPPLPEATSVPQDYEYPEAINEPDPITEDQLTRCIVKLQPYKAPGPDRIWNIVYKQCAKVLSPHLLCLFHTSLRLNTYYDPWCKFTTVVLQKPGRPDYTVMKVYHPIALLNTMGKLLTAIVADQLTYILETNDLLPRNHFCG
ncbi:hypothetical protein BDN67DRAFT_913087, partial [Paxillus ammoniavirescens]